MSQNSFHSPNGWNSYSTTSTAITSTYTSTAITATTASTTITTATYNNYSHAVSQNCYCSCSGRLYEGMATMPKSDGDQIAGTANMLAFTCIHVFV